MVAALAGIGHRQIAFLAGPPTLYVARERLAGFRRGLADVGIVANEEIIRHSTFDRAGGSRGVDELLATGVEFTAICCANDLLALGVLERLGELGIPVSEGMSVAGFDDISVASMTAPALSTVRLPLRELGRRGFEYAIRQLNDEPVTAELLPTEVVLRDSTGVPGRVLAATKGIA
jgi:LacI family transcriptional regulator